MAEVFVGFVVSLAARGESLSDGLEAGGKGRGEGGGGNGAGG